MSDLDQGSAEWLAARAGMITASRIADLMAKTKTGESASRGNYRAQLVAERLTGKPQDSFSNAAMQWGTEQEPMARSAYEILRGEMIEQVGFVPHPEIDKSGASPDGLIGNDGLIEIKCPNTATHIEYAVSGKPPTKYLLQMLWQMECTGRKWCDFVSYDPRMPPDMQLFIVRINRDDERINEIKTEVIKLNSEIADQINKLGKVFNNGIS